MNGAMMSSVKMDWNTPDSFLEIVRRVAPIGLDPATDASNPTGARRFFTPADNGLIQPWTHEPGELVFVNPPYGRALGDWAAAVDRAANGGARIVTLVPARTDTKWFRQMLFARPQVCFLRGRLKFKGAKDPAPFPCAVLYHGTKPQGFVDVFAEHGIIMSAY